MAIIASPAFCDYVSCTTPRDYYPKVSEALLEVVTAAGGRDEKDGVVRLGQGTFVHGQKYGIGYYSLSGDALQEMRKARDVFYFFGEWLTIIGEQEHRVTRLDAAVDIPVEASTVVTRVYKRARAGGISLTRKAVPPDQVERIFSPAYVGGRDTGSVLLGSRGRDVRARVYDKRQELLRRVRDAHGGLTAELIALNDPGPLVRYELELGRKVGMTLRDAYEPARVFWHFARESLLPQLAPRDVGNWEPHSLGFAVPRAVHDPAKQLSLLLESSADIRRAVTLADRLGPYGREYLN